jgi:hypothetical protein
MNETVESLNCATRVELASATPLKGSTIQQFNKAAGPFNGAAGTIQQELWI